MSVRRRPSLVTLFAVATVMALTVVTPATAWSSPLGVAATRAPDAWTLGARGAGVGVVIVDTGIAANPVLDPVVVARRSFSAASATTDEVGHGTFVAGLVHQAAPDAHLISLKVAAADGSVDVTQVLAALQWIASNRVRYDIGVVNLSFGADADATVHNDLLDYAVERLWDAGVVVVASAGNRGPGPLTVTRPGDDPLVVTVGSSDDGGTLGYADDTLDPETSIGTTAAGVAKPDVLAPGQHLVSLRVPGSLADESAPAAAVGELQFRGSGTSFATAIVSGIVADIRSVRRASPDEVKARLVRTARHPAGLPLPGPGVVDAYAAVTATGFWTGQWWIARNTGAASLDATRGHARVVVRTATGAVATVRGQTTSSLSTFDATAYRSSGWAPDSWSSTQWSDPGSTWQSTEWSAFSWGSASWWAFSWG